MKRTKKPATTVDKVRSFAERLATELESIVAEHVDDLLERAHGYAVERLRADVAAGGGHSVVDEEVVDRSDVVHRDVKPGNISTGKRRCTKCRKPGHRAPQCEEDAEPDKAMSTPSPRSAHAETAAKTRRADLIAKRAGVLPTPSASFDTEDD